MDSIAGIECPNPYRQQVKNIKYEMTPHSKFQVAHADIGEDVQVHSVDLGLFVLAIVEKPLLQAVLHATQSILPVFDGGFVVVVSEGLVAEIFARRVGRLYGFRVQVGVRHMSTF